MAPPPMIVPSTATTVAFVTLVVALAVAFVAAVAYVGRAGAESLATGRRRSWPAAVGVAVLLSATGWASASGVLGPPAVPAAVMAFFGGSMLTMVVVAMSELGRRLATHVPIVALVGVQAFRLPLELVLHRWYVEGVLPVQMTYEGHNFDIVTGIAAIVVAIWLHLRGPSWRVVLAFNTLGFGLLVTVASIALRSTPGPLRTYTADPPVQLAFHFPYGWIVPVCVGGALFAHILVFRWSWWNRPARVASMGRRAPT